MQQQTNQSFKNNNICIFNIPESKEKDEKKAFHEDINKIKEIFKDKMEFSKQDVAEIYRTNGREDNNRTRPIIVRFVDVNKKN